jgi:hypothetical protein
MGCGLPLALSLRRAAGRNLLFAFLLVAGVQSNEMKLKGSTLVGSAYSIYFITAIILSVYFSVSWINTFDFLFGLVLLLGLSLWYIADRIWHSDSSRPRKSRWMITSYGWPYRRSENCPPHNSNPS